MPKQNIPKHVAIVMDGNGRWAKNKHLPRVAGHKVGTERVRDAVQFCIKNDIEVLTLFAFSTENWSRPKEEVGFLMELFFKKLRSEVKELHKNKVKLMFIGNRHELNEQLQQEMRTVEKLTENNESLKLVLAINYSGRWDIVNAVKQIAIEIQNGVIDGIAIDDAKVKAHLCLYGLPEPDLFIRTSGEQRISNFMLWQLAYTELYFTEVFWPDFDEKEFAKALTVYAQRNRRFGKLKEDDEC